MCMVLMDGKHGQVVYRYISKEVTTITLVL